MIKVLKIMLSDILPKSFYSFFKGVGFIAILFAVLTGVAIFLIGIAAFIGWLLAIPVDLGMLILCSIILIAIWIDSAHGRSR